MKKIFVKANKPWVGSLEVQVISSYSWEYFPNALKLMDCERYGQSVACKAKMKNKKVNHSSVIIVCICECTVEKNILKKSILLFLGWNSCHSRKRAHEGRPQNSKHPICGKTWTHWWILERTWRTWRYLVACCQCEIMRACMKTHCKVPENWAFSRLRDPVILLVERNNLSEAKICNFHQRLTSHEDISGC